MILRTASRIFTDDKLVMMARNYFECTQDNNLIMDIFEDMGLSPQEIIAVLMQTKQPPVGDSDSADLQATKAGC